MAGSDRSRRVGEQIKRILAEIILREMRDDSLKMLSITAVKVSSDFSVARVYVTALVDTVGREKIVSLLNDESKFLRNRLSKQLNLRRTPHLHFVYDASVEYGSAMETLIDDIIAEDKRNKS